MGVDCARSGGSFIVVTASLSRSLKPQSLIIWLKPSCEPQLHGVGAGSPVGSCFEKERRRRCFAAEPLQSALSSSFLIILVLLLGYYILKGNYYSGTYLRFKQGGDWSLPVHEIL